MTTDLNKTYDNEPPVGLAGDWADGGADRHAITRFTEAVEQISTITVDTFTEDVAEVSTVTVDTAANSTDYSLDVNGYEVHITSDANATKEEIVDALVAAWAAQTEAAAYATVAKATTETYTVTGQEGVALTITVDANQSVVEDTAAVEGSGPYVTTIDGIAITVAAPEGGDAEASRDALVAAINANTFLAAKLTAAPHATETDQYTLSFDDYDLHTVTVDADQSVELSTAPSGGDVSAGLGVVKGTGSQAVRLPSASGDSFKGMILRNRAETSTGMSEDKPRSVALARKGRVWVTAEETVAEDDPVYCRYASGTGGSQRGSFRKDADTSTAFLVEGAKWATAASAGELAAIDFNLP